MLMAPETNIPTSARVIKARVMSGKFQEIRQAIGTPQGRPVRFVDTLAGGPAG